MRILLFCFFVGFASSAMAGNGWVSSGGDLFRSEKNPWFLKNVLDVRYCILIDEPAVSVNLSTIRAEITSAFSYWKNEFNSLETMHALTQVDDPVVGFAKIATQKFVERPCDGQEDLRFVFGVKHLTSEQRRFLKPIRKHLGAAVRTTYDRVNMRGRGFLFIAADRGADAFIGAAPDDLLWQKSNVLRATIVHELGHVFGLPHFGAHIMSESFAEKVSGPISGTVISQMANLPAVFRSPEKSNNCEVSREILWALGLRDPDLPHEGFSVEYCLILEQQKVDKAGGITRWKLSAQNIKTLSVVELGELASDRSDVTKPLLPIDFSMTTVGGVYLTRDQKVFADAELFKVPDVKDPTGKKFIYLDYLLTGVSLSFGGPAKLVLKMGVTRSTYISRSAEGIKIVAEFNGQYRLIFKTDSLMFF